VFRRSVLSIEPVSSVPVRCVGIDTASHLYLAGEAMIPTHNTDTALDILGWRQATSPRPSLYVGPSKEFVSTIVEDRISEMLANTRGLRVDPLKSTKLLKIVNGVRVRLGWGGSPSSLASDQAGDIIVDEYDKMFRAQRRAGDPYVLALARGDTYADRKMLVTSTPEQGRVEVTKDEASGLEFWKVADTEMVESRIWRRFQTGTMHHAVWHCPHCTSWFVPRMKDLMTFKGAKPGDALRKTWIVCPKSGCVIEEESRDEMNANVRFVAPGQQITSDGFVTGDAVSTDVLSVWVSGLMSPFVAWGKRKADLMTAVLTGEPEAIQGVMNSAGECWSPVEVKQLTEDALRLKCMDYDDGQVPKQVVLVTMGVDVQGNRLVCVIRGWGAGGQSYRLKAFEIFGLTRDPKVWAELAVVFDWTFGGLRISRCFVDAGFRPDKREAGDYHKVLDFCRRYKHVAYATRGKARQSKPILKGMEQVTAQGKADKYGLETLTLDTDFFKSRWFAALDTEPGLPMSAHFPREIEADYAKQIISEVRSDDGEWVQVYRQNHYLDAESLAGAAAYMLKASEIPANRMRVVDDEDEDDFKIVKPEEVLVPVPKKSMVDRLAELHARANQ
jgi:phage terminase large subunit GpA-like protein